MRVVGYDGAIQLDGESIVILRHSLIGKIGHGWKPRTLPLARMEDVGIRLPTWTVNGEIWFTMPGEPRTPNRIDHNAVLFLKKHQEDFLTLYDAVRTAVAARMALRLQSVIETAYELSTPEQRASFGAPTSMPDVLPQQTLPALSASDQLLKLKELYDEGVLSYEEYSAKAAPLIERL